MVLRRGRFVEQNSTDIPVGEVARPRNVVISLNHFAVARGTSMFGFPCSHAVHEGFAVHVHAEKFAFQAHPLVYLVQTCNLLHDGRVFRKHGRLVPAEIVRVIHEDFLLGQRGLCLDEHHAEGRPGSINGSGGSVLEHRDALDVLRIQIGNVIDGHAVDDVKRIGSGVVGQSSDTADPDRGRVADLTVGIDDGQTRNGSLQGFAQIDH